MKTQLTNSLKSVVLIIAAVFMSMTIAKAEELKKVEKAGLFRSQNNVDTWVLSWEYKDININGVGFDVYLADGHTEDPTAFQAISTDSLSRTLKRDSSGYWFALPIELEVGKYTVYIETTKEGKDNVTSEFFKLEVKGFSAVWLKPQNERMNAFVGKEWTYTPVVEGKIDGKNVADMDLNYTFSLDRAPEGAEIDENTGTITWTPEDANEIKQAVFLVSGVIEGYPSIKLEGKYFVDVLLCENPGSLSVNVLTEDGETVEKGHAFLLIIQNKEGKNSNIFVIRDAKFENGLIEFNGLDAGEYYLTVEAPGYYSYAYEDITLGPNSFRDFENFTPINLECDEEINVTAKLKEFVEPNLFEVSGVVLDEETNEPLHFSVVEFIGTNKETNSTKVFSASTKFETGEFKIKLPDNHTYVALAIGFSLGDKDTIIPSVYMPEYYDGVEDPSEAKVLDLTDDIDNINFYLTKYPTYENSISGTVVDSESKEALPYMSVVVFMVEGQEWNDRNKFMGRGIYTDENGNFTLTNLIPGEYVIMIQGKRGKYMPGYYVEGDVATRSWEDATTITIGENSEITTSDIQVVKLEERFGKGRVKGRIERRKEMISIGKDNDATQAENSVGGANIFIEDSEGYMYHGSFSNSDGSFEIEGLENGKYTVYVDRVGYHESSSTIEITDDNETINREIELDPVVVASVERSEVITGENIAYPNPASVEVNVEFYSLGGNTSIKVNDIEGKIVLEENVNSTSGYNAYNLDLNNLSVGTYYISIQNGQSLEIIPLIISR